MGVGTQTTGYLPESGADFVDKYEPAGSVRNSTGYYGAMRRLRAPSFVAGIKGTGYAVATLTKTGTGGNAIATAKYPGILGNSILWSLGAASNGDTTARDMTFTLSDPNGVTGTTTEVYKNAPMTLGGVGRCVSVEDSIQPHDRRWDDRLADELHQCRSHWRL